MRPLLIALAAACTAVTAIAAPANVDPLGLELDVASITQVRAKLGGAKVSEPGSSAITGGRLIVADSPKLGPDGLQKATFVFNQQDRLVGVELVFQKDFAGKNVNGIADSLAKKYQQKSRSLPAVGDGTARYAFGKSVAIVNAPHMSFEFTVSYMTEEFERNMVARAQAAAEQSKKRTESAL